MQHCLKCEEELNLLLPIDDCFCEMIVTQLPLEDDAMTVEWQ
jgi:hypothetical protein